jgi:hypothetical protein
MAYAPVNGMNNGRAERLFDDASHERPVYSMGGAITLKLSKRTITNGGCQGEIASPPDLSECGARAVQNWQD